MMAMQGTESNGLKCQITEMSITWSRETYQHQLANLSTEYSFIFIAVTSVIYCWF